MVHDVSTLSWLVKLLPLALVARGSGNTGDGNSNNHVFSNIDDEGIFLCVSALVDADQDDSGSLNREEFATFCTLEAHRTPLQLLLSEQEVTELFHPPDTLPPSLWQLYDSYPGAISIAGAKDFYTTQPELEHQKEALVSLCQIVTESVANVLEGQAVAATDKDATTTTTTRSTNNINIIVMQPDDLKFYDVWGSPPNNPGDNANRAANPLPTAGMPNIERLRTNGLQMRQAYTASPMCGTSRYSTMTGRYPSRSATSRRRNSNDNNVPDFIPSVIIPTTKLEDQDGLHDCTQDNLAAAFKGAGYRTGMIGKWHLSSISDADYTYDTAVETVQGCGFDFVGGLYVENMASKPEEFDNYSDGTFSHNMEWITSEAIDFINNNAADGDGDDDDPFFLYFNPTVPHSSNDVRLAITDFSCRATPNGILDADPVIKGMTDGGTTTDCDTYRQTILDRAVEEDDLGAIWLDDSVGALLRTLEDKGILDNTIFLFQQDHGMDTKGALYENGVRIAQFVHYPNGVGTSGVELDVPVSTIDIAPTLLDFAGIPNPYDMDGRSWRSVLEEESEEDRIIEDWKYNRCLFLELEEDRAVRCGCDKFLRINQPPDSSTTAQSGEKNGLSHDDENLFDLCGGTADYITGEDNADNPEAQGENKLAQNTDLGALLADAIQCHLARTDPSVDPDYQTSCDLGARGPPEVTAGGSTDVDTSDEDTPSTEGDAGDDLVVETSFVLSNTIGLVAEDIENDYLDSLTAAFQDAIANDGFAELVLENLNELEQGGNEGDGGGTDGGGGGGTGGGGGGGGPVTCPTDSQYIGTPSDTPQAAPLRGSIGCVDVSAQSLRNTDDIPVFQGQDAVNIYGPMEAGFSSANGGLTCLGDNVVPGGLDTNLAEHVVAHLCPDENIQVLDACGGHAMPYHYHERMDCLYTSDIQTGHSTRIGTAKDGNGIYGKFIDGGVEPADLDVCGGRVGITPDSNGEEVYYYTITAAAPFSLGCYGPISTVEECRQLYPSTCGDEMTIESVTTNYGTGLYALDCPCFDDNGSNVEGQGRPGYLAPVDDRAGRRRRRFLEDTVFDKIYRRGSPQIRRFLQEADIDIDSARIDKIEDADCPRSARDDTKTCQNVYAVFGVTTDGSMKSGSFNRAYLKAMQEWIEQGGLQAMLPDDSPFTIEKVLSGARANRDRVLVDSSFIITSPDGKTAAELNEANESEEVTSLTRAYSKLVRRVGKRLGANETTFADEELLEANPFIQFGQGMVQEGQPNNRPNRTSGNESQQGNRPGQQQPSGNRTNQGGGRVRDLQGRRQFSGVGLDIQSAAIYNYVDSICSDNDTAAAVSRQQNDEGQRCITAFGKYRVFVDDEEESIEDVYAGFLAATQESIAEGELEETLQEAAAETNTTVSFEVAGASSLTDENFDAYVEADQGDEASETVAPTMTAAPSFNASSSATSTSNATTLTDEATNATEGAGRNDDISSSGGNRCGHFFSAIIVIVSFGTFSSFV